MPTVQGLPGPRKKKVRNEQEKSKRKKKPKRGEIHLILKKEKKKKKKNNYHKNGFVSYRRIKEFKARLLLLFFETFAVKKQITTPICSKKTNKKKTIHIQVYLDSHELVRIL